MNMLECQQHKCYLMIFTLVQKRQTEAYLDEENLANQQHLSAASSGGQ